MYNISYNTPSYAEKTTPVHGNIDKVLYTVWSTHSYNDNAMLAVCNAHVCLYVFVWDN